jgi:transcriptional regulator with XRE-family HTH domain
MIRSPQIKAARTLLGWSIRDLARRTGLDVADVQELESAAKVPNLRCNDLALIQAIPEEAGVEFIDLMGVQLGPPDLKHIAVTERGQPGTGH